MNSCLYECRVIHNRSQPKRHRFEYGVFFFCIDLDELDKLPLASRLIATNQQSLYSFFDQDFIDESRMPCRDKVMAHIEEASPESAAKISQIRLLTCLRLFGYIFNPVSIYYCLDVQDNLVCAIAEVTNTFRESKLYFVQRPVDTRLNSSESASQNESSDQIIKALMPKFFYVSPFSNLDTFFDFTIVNPGQILQLNINTVENSVVTLASTVNGKRVSLTTLELLRLTFCYPLMSLRTITLIHWHALKLFLKGVPFIRKEANPQMQTNVLRVQKSE